MHATTTTTTTTTLFPYSHVSTWYYLLFYIIFNAFHLYDILTKRANEKHTIKISEFIFFVRILLFGSNDNFVYVKLTYSWLSAKLDLDPVT